VYGHPAFGDERVLLNVAHDRSVRAARVENGKVSSWIPLTRWEIEDATLTFTDSRSGRAYEADLTRTSLGGRCRTLTLLGGSSCSPADFAVAPTADSTKAETLIPPLLPTLTS